MQDCLTHKVLHSSRPQYLKDELVLLTDSHVHNTRNTNTLRIPAHRLEHYKNSLNYNCASVWNTLPLDLRQIEDSLKFSVMAKRHFHEKQSVSIIT